MALLGAGDDVFHWDPGDGSDIVEGQAGRPDGLQRQQRPRPWTSRRNGGRVRFFRDAANITMD